MEHANNLEDLAGYRELYERKGKDYILITVLEGMGQIQIADLFEGAAKLSLQDAV